MRIWDLPPRLLCRAHLLGEHRELHAIWAVLTKGKKGYANHPETLRWKGKLKALYARHQALVDEMERRGYTHKTDLLEALARGSGIQKSYVHTPREQRMILRKKGCDCDVHGDILSTHKKPMRRGRTTVHRRVLARASPEAGA